MTFLEHDMRQLYYVNVAIAHIKKYHIEQLLISLADNLSQIELHSP